MNNPNLADVSAGRDFNLLQFEWNFNIIMGLYCMVVLISLFHTENIE